MAEKDLNLNDIAEELLIVDRRTIEHLFELENCADCVALYMFLYKTAKWQRTNAVKANDTYIRKCLGWGAKKVTATKSLLEKACLIKKISRRKDGKIIGHFIEVEYLLHQNTPKPQHSKATCGFGETNAYKTNNRCLINSNSKIDTKVSIGDESPEEYGKHEINLLFESWERETGLPITSNTQKNRYACNNLLNKFGLDGAEKLIRIAGKAQIDKFAPRVADFCDLQAKLNQVFLWAKNKSINESVNQDMVEV